MSAVPSLTWRAPRARPAPEPFRGGAAPDEARSSGADRADATVTLELEGLTKAFGATPALDAASLRVRAGTVHCVLGENGAGKSTLCNLVFGAHSPDAGTMRLYGEPYAPQRPADALAAGVAMVHQHFSLVPTMTVAENLLLGTGLRLRPPRRELLGELDAVADTYGLSLDPDARVDALPVGIRQQVEIVKCLLRKPRLLLLDEPTGVLDPAQIESLMATCRRIAEAGHAVVLVTHKLAEVARAGDEATVLRGGRVVGGGPLAGIAQSDLVAMMVGRRVAELDPLLAAGLGLEGARPEGVGPEGSGADESAVDAAPDGGGPPAPGATVPAAAAATSAGAPRAAALAVRGLTVRRPDGTTALDAVSLTVARGEILGVAGVEGNGQSELGAVLAGSLRARSGSVELDGHDITAAPPARRTRLGLGVVPEDRLHEGCIGELSVAENLFLARLADFRRYGLLDRRALNRAADEVVAAHAIRTEDSRAPMRTLSGGNQQKVVLARELALDPLVCLVASQPTRGLDIGAVGAVVTRLRDAAARGCGILLISSELSELLAVADRIVVMYRGRALGPVRTGEPGARERLGRLMTGADA
ncbi:ABC transporter ATP-binding protein [Yinghuangia soli]|uniref:ATP-binding cassette domain-containing protein n=1 Tax=Yinghuangia soli TaxID=2908204 RepID=A0AA41PZB9_9ACTN|nr:ATP-binding cassette domain-containing protein [Yinghuangia soli]MCF2527232.1 ATP-binding cassette domain-containing protein [Yinghuangia soli]